MRPLVCWKCGQRGHLRAMCKTGIVSCHSAQGYRRPSERSFRRQIVCKFCCQVGHVESRCFVRDQVGLERVLTRTVESQWMYSPYGWMWLQSGYCRPFVAVNCC